MKKSKLDALAKKKMAMAKKMGKDDEEDDDTRPIKKAV